MNTFARIHQSIYHSSIAEDWQMRCVFMDLLILADIETGVVNMTHEAIARTTNVPLDIIKENIKKLESPDERSQCREQDGRRLVRIDPDRDWGWIIVSWDIWKERSKMAVQREQNLERVRKFREKKKVKNDDEPPKDPPKTPPKSSKEPKKRERNEFFDILAGAGDQNPEAMTESEGGRVAKALSDIRKACPDLTTDELKRRIQNYRLHFPEAILTPTAISSNWSRLESAPAQKSPTPRDTNPSRKNENLQSKVLSVNP